MLFNRLLVLACLGALPSACSRNHAEPAPERETEQISEWPADNRLDVFGESTNGVVFVFPDQNGVEMHVDARDRNDRDGQSEVDLKATAVDAATKCRLTGATFASGHFRTIEVLEGPHRGLCGYVAKAR